MLRSMTGYGRGEYAPKSGEQDGSAGAPGFVVEIKSVNHRFCDITVKQPRELMQFEERIKDLVKEYAVRGKIDVFVTPAAGAAQEVKVEVDRGIVRAYAEAFMQIDRELNEVVADETLARCHYQGDRNLPPAKPALSLFTGIPGVLNVVHAEKDPEAVWAQLAEAVRNAAEAFAAMRLREGEKLAQVLKATGEAVKAQLETVRARAPFIPAEYKKRLEERLEELDRKSADPQRIAAEVAIFADRCSIDEEIARLDSHLSQFDQLLASDGPAGRQLDFLVQEMNREVNTIGSKANDLTLTQAVLNMKNEIEKLREQIQNVE